MKEFFSRVKRPIAIIVLLASISYMALFLAFYWPSLYDDLKTVQYRSTRSTYDRQVSIWLLDATRCRSVSLDKCNEISGCRLYECLPGEICEEPPFTPHEIRCTTETRHPGKRL